MFHFQLCSNLLCFIFNFVPNSTLFHQSLKIKTSKYNVNFSTSTLCTPCGSWYMYIVNIEIHYVSKTDQDPLLRFIFLVISFLILTNWKCSSLWEKSSHFVRISALYNCHKYIQIPNETGAFSLRSLWESDTKLEFSFKLLIYKNLL